MSEIKSLPGRRLDYDILRNILVVLVVFNHSVYYTINTAFGGVYYGIAMKESGILDTNIHHLCSLLSSWINTFHMPAFMSLSGVLFFNQYREGRYHTIGNVIKSKFKRLLIPFMFAWLILNIPLKYYTGYYIGISASKIILQMLFPEGVHLWFLESLFFVFIISVVILKYIKSKKTQYLLIISFTLIGQILELSGSQYIPIGNPLRYIIWFWVGGKLEETFQFLRNRLGKFFILILWLAEIAIYLISKIVIHYNELIAYELNTIFLPFIMIPILYSLSHKLELYVRQNKIAMIYREFSQYSMGIYLYSETFNYVLMFVAIRLFGIDILGKELESFLLILSRNMIPPLCAMLVIIVLKKLHLKQFY